MNARKLKKAILAEALYLYSRSGGFPVRRFWIDTQTHKCTGEVEFDGPYALLDNLVSLCRQLSARR